MITSLPTETYITVAADERAPLRGLKGEFTNNEANERGWAVLNLLEAQDLVPDARKNAGVFRQTLPLLGQRNFSFSLPELEGATAITYLQNSEQEHDSLLLTIGPEADASGAIANIGLPILGRGYAREVAGLLVRRGDGGWEATFLQLDSSAEISLGIHTVDHYDREVTPRKGLSVGSMANGKYSPGDYVQVGGDSGPRLELVQSDRIGRPLIIRILPPAPTK